GGPSSEAALPGACAFVGDVTGRRPRPVRFRPRRGPPLCKAPRPKAPGGRSGRRCTRSGGRGQGGLDLPFDGQPGPSRAGKNAEKTSVHSFDLIVLGGGSGGLATAQRAAEYGAKVALFEPARLGGTCVNVGCVPKKVMWNAAELGQAIAYAADYGFDVRVAGHDWAALKAGRDAYVERLNGIYQRNLERRDIRIVPSAGRFEGPHEIVDASGDRYTAPHIVIATGGYPIVPELPGAGRGITSDGFFELDARPERVAIVGSGYV